MEEINTIKFFIGVILFLLVVISIITNNLIIEYNKKEKQYNQIINELCEQNYQLEVYKARKEFSNSKY